jgi:hypothetical protein
MQVQIVSTTLLVFVNGGEDSIMVDDVVTPSNIPIASIEEKKFKETSLDMNVSRRLREEEPSKIVVRLELIFQHGIIDYLLTQMP